MHPEINKLLSKAAQKGVILHKEKEEILKKGIELGIDKLVLEMYISNYQYNKNSATVINTKKCPKCNANIPLLSNICSFCGAELDQSNQISDDELIENINKNIVEVEKLRTASLLESLYKYGGLFFGFLSVVTILITLIFLPGAISLSVLLYVILGIASYIYYKKNNFASPNLRQKLENISSNFDKNQNLFKLYYTNNSELHKLTKNFNNKVKIIRNTVKSISTKTIIIYSAAFVVLFSLSLYNSAKKDYSYLKNTTTFESNAELFKSDKSKTFTFFNIFPNITHASEFIRRIGKNPNIIISAEKKEYIKGNSMNNETGNFFDSRDGHTYETIKIGDQTWFAENLAYDAGDGCWVYDNYADPIGKKGRLYDYETAKKSCPKGWHLPTDEEWSILINFLGGEDVAGEKLKNYLNWQLFEGENRGNNASGFSAIPSGCRRSDDKGGEFINKTYYAYWWTSTSVGKNSAWIRFLDSSTKIDRQKAVNKYYGYSVRCIKDK